MGQNNISLVIVVLCLSFMSCNSQKGHNGASNDVKEAKDRGVFITEYTVNENPFVINDSIKIKVKEAWLEKQWKYPENSSKTVIGEEFQLCVNVEEEKHLKDLGFTWSIGVDFDRNMRTSGPASLISDFKNYPPDTIEYKVQKGSELSDNYEKIIIGKFVLVKKK